VVVVTLRPVQISDLPVLYEHQRDPVASAQAAFVARDWHAFVTHWTGIVGDPDVLSRAVLADGQLAGNLLAFTFEGRRELGYWIGRQWWGRGVATAAVARFLTIETTRPLYASVTEGNVASMRVLEKVGFVPARSASGRHEYVLPA
jgi:RimJ/RimL family protein N-acetyltransferase